MTIGRNVLAGLANSIWSALIGLAVVPLYLRYLGLEAYGLIGFFATTQAVLQVLDMGLAPTVNREVARCAAEGDLSRAGKLLHTLALVYWAMAFAIGLVLVVTAPALARGWIRSGQLSPGTVTQAVALMGLIVACRWPVGLYLGALMGAERMALASGLGIAMTTLANLGAVAVLAFVSPTVQAFFVWQAGAGLIQALATRQAAWRAIGRSPGLRFDRSELRRVWRFSAGMSGIAIYGLLFTQLDKVLLSKMLRLEDFGRYMLATTVAAGLYVLVTPLSNAVYPRFCALVVRGDTEQLANLYRQSTRLLASVLFPVTTLLLFSGEGLIRLWTRNDDLARAVAPLVALLAMGSALHGVMYLPYALQLAYGKTRLALRINTILLVTQVPLLVVLALSYGALGGAVAWLVLHLLYLAFGTWMTHRELLRGVGTKWLLQDVGAPLAISLALGLGGHQLLAATGWTALVRVACGVVVAGFASVLCFVSSPGLLGMTLESLGWRGSAARVD